MTSDKEDENSKQVVTPEHIKEQLEALKHKMKRDYLTEQRERALFKNNLSHCLPCHVNQLFRVSEYKLLTAESVQQPLLFKDQPRSIASAEKPIAEVILFRWSMFSSSRITIS